MVFFISAAFSPIQDLPSFTCKKKQTRACVCVWVNDRTTETKPNNKDRLLQHQRYFISPYKYFQTTRNTHLTHQIHKHTTRARTYEQKHTQHTTQLIHHCCIYVCCTCAYHTAAATILSAAHRNDHHRSNQQQTTNQKQQSYQRRG